MDIITTFDYFFIFFILILFQLFSLLYNIKMNTETCVIHKKTKIIPIKKNKNLLQENSEYSLKQGFFDPMKSSPPNDFLIKLKLRIKNFDTKF